MGCDIHIVVQYRGYNDKSWRTAEPPRGAWEGWGAPRDYDAFAALANVRNRGGITPIDEPRGLPDDFERTEEDNLGDHSFSWLLASEILSYPQQELLGYFADFARTLPRMLWVHEPEHIRIVFGFDS